MLEVNLFSIWIPIIITVIIIIIGMVLPGGGGDYSFEGCFILAGVVISVLVVWIIWFICRSIFS